MTDRTARQLTIASLLTETASVIHTNDLRDRPGRTPAQNSALPPAVSLYGAFNIVICGDPDDTRGERDGVNSADLVRTFNSFLNTGSALEWSQAPERTHAEIMNALHACALALRDAADRATSSARMVGDMFTGPRMLVHVGDVVRHTGMVSNLIVTSRHGDRGFWLTPESGGEPFVWDDYEMPGNEGSPFTLISCPHLDDSAELAAGDPADDEEIEAGPDFPVACASMHEHDPVACAPEPIDVARTMVHEVTADGREINTTDLGVSAYPVTDWIVSVISDDYEGDPDAWAGSVLSIPSMDTFLDMLRDVGLSVGTDRSGGEIIYASVICPTGYIRLRRPNPGELTPVRVRTVPIQSDAEAETEPVGEKPSPRRYRLGVLPMSTGTVYGVRDVARDVVLSDVFGPGYGTWSGTREAAEAEVTRMNRTWLAAGGWSGGPFVDPDAWITVDAYNGPERWDGRRWNHYVTDAMKNETAITVRILSID